MAVGIYARGKTYRAQFSVKGKRYSGTFDTKKEAEYWLQVKRKEVIDFQNGETPDITFGKLLERYRDQVTCRKRSAKWETNRINWFIKSEPLCKVSIKDLRTRHFVEMRDRRLNEVSGETVRRDFNLLSAALNTAVKEWEWLKKNPLSNVRRPPEGKARFRRPTVEETERLLHVTGYQRDWPCEHVAQRVAVAYLFAIETAMRAGEICSLSPLNVDLQRRVARLEQTKNGDARDVPLSLEAIHLLKQLMPWGATKPIFRLTSATLDANFRKYKKMAAIGDLHFHDTRHEAITRLVRIKKLEVLPLARMTGHRNINELMTYYNETAEEIAERIA